MQVFLRCSQTWCAGMSGAFALGLTAREVEAGCRLCGIARAARTEVADQVLDMGRTAAQALNARVTT